MLQRGSNEVGFLKKVNYPAQREGISRNLIGGLHPLPPRSTFIPAHRIGYSARGFYEYN